MPATASAGVHDPTTLVMAIAGQVERGAARARTHRRDPTRSPHPRPMSQNPPVSSRPSAVSATRNGPAVVALLGAIHRVGVGFNYGPLHNLLACPSRLCPRLGVPWPAEFPSRTPQCPRCTPQSEAPLPTPRVSVGRYGRP